MKIIKKKATKNHDQEPPRREKPRKLSRFARWNLPVIPYFFWLP
ncbi:MAG: hypothetical protein WCG27_04570 [Pseudomonadota bacterium]